MFNWTTFKRGGLYVYMDTDSGRIGGFASKGEKDDPQWMALGPTTKLSPGGLPSSFFHHHPILGEFGTLGEAQKEVETRTREGDYGSEKEILVDIDHP